MNRMVIMELIREYAEFTGLEDTQENIEAPEEQLDDCGKFIVRELKRVGIDTEDKVIEFSHKYIEPLFNYREAYEKLK